MYSMDKTWLLCYTDCRQSVIYFHVKLVIFLSMLF